jgi:hypothetical protein
MWRQQREGRDNRDGESDADPPLAELVAFFVDLSAPSGTAACRKPLSPPTKRTARAERGMQATPTDRSLLSMQN